MNIDCYKTLARRFDVLVSHPAICALRSRDAPCTAHQIDSFVKTLGVCLDTVGEDAAAAELFRWVTGRADPSPPGQLRAGHALAVLGLGGLALVSPNGLMLTSALGLIDRGEIVWEPGHRRLMLRDLRRRDDAALAMPAVARPGVEGRGPAAHRGGGQRGGRGGRGGGGGHRGGRGGVAPSIAPRPSADAIALAEALPDTAPPPRAPTAAGPE